jgi:outer membrane protein assembly factor BamB
MMNVRSAVALSAALACLSAPASAAQLEWSRTVQSGIADTSAVVANVDGTGGQEIVLCSTGGLVLVWDAEGKEIWSYDLGDMITVPPTVADIDARAGLEICAMDSGGTLTCLSAAGKRLWDYRLPAGIGWGSTTVVVRDIDRDGSAEVLTADSGGHVVCLDRRGTVKWLYGCPSPVNSPLAVANLDERGGDEILFGSDDGYVRCLSSDGEPLWTFQAGSAVRSGPVVMDIDGRPGPEVLVGSQDGMLHALSGDGSLLWRFDSGAEIDSCISVADIDADGHADILLGNLRGDLFRLTADGTESWRYDVKMRSRRSAVMGDLDADGDIEILLGNYSGYLYVLTVTGNLEERILLGGSMNAAPAVADLNGDGRLEAVCPITSGEVRCYSWYTTASQQPALALWPMYRYDAAQTASPSNAKQAPETVTARADYGQLLVSGNEYRLDVSNPSGKKLRIEQTIRVRGAPAASRRVTESAEPQIIASLTYEIDGRAARDIQFGYTVFEQGTKKALCRGGEPFYVVPFANDLALMRQLVGTLRTTGEIDESSAEYFAAQRDCFAQRLRRLEESVARASSLDDDEFAELKAAVTDSVEELERLNALSRMAESAYQRVGSQLVAWAANPWPPFGGIGDLPDELPTAARFDLDVYRGEYASAAFNVANLSPEPLTVRVTLEDMREASAASGAESALNPYSYFTLHEVAAVPTVRGNYSADALPRLNQGRLVTLPPWSARQVWLIFCADDLEPGTYTTGLALTSLELEPVSARCEVSARVRSVALPTPSPLRLCNWGYVYSSVISDFEEEARDDLVSHGTNVFVITTHHTPAAQFDSTGNLVGKIDYTKHDFIVNLYKDHGLLMFFNYQAVLKGRDSDGYMSPAWKKAYAAWLTEWVGHLRDLGVGYDGFALYPVDEPGLHDTGRSLIDKFIEIGKLTREVDPKIHIYTDPVAGARLEHLKEMAPYVDIWCPNRNAIVLARNDARLDFLLSTGKPVWTYECEGSAKEQPPLVYYRGQAWLAWHHGLTGIGFWSYCTSRFDPWFRPVGERANDYLLIYQGDGIVTSKRWEACRDGVEDYGALWELRRLAKLAKEQGSNPDLVNRATRLLDTAADDVAEWSGGAHRAAYLRDPGSVADRDWQILKEYRTRIADLTEQIQAELSAK